MKKGIIKLEASNFKKRTDYLNNVFSKNLKNFRQQKNYTQEQVADILGISSHTVSRWECNITLPDVTLLPEIAKLYCVTIDDFFKETSIAYQNYAQRLASIYETTRKTEDFIYADNEFKKLIKSGEYTTEDLWTYGTLYHFMMQYSIKKAIDLFDKVIDIGKDVNEEVFWKTKNQKIFLYSQIGRSKECIIKILDDIIKNSNDIINWRCLISAYIFDNDIENAYKSLKKAIKQFPNDAIIYTLGGDICSKLKNYDEAIIYWNKAIELDNSCLDAKYSKINYYAQIGEKDKCHRLSSEIVEELKKSGLDIEADAEENRLKNLINNI